MQLARAAKGLRSRVQPALPDAIAGTLGIFLLALFVLIFAISPLNGEDYALTMRPDGMNFLQRLLWVFVRSHTQVMTWNARLGEQLAIFWLIQPRFLFVVANTLVFAAFLALLAVLATGPASFDKRFLRACLMACAVCFLLWPRMEIFFWSTAAAGYLHPLTLTLAFIIPFRLPQLRHKLMTSRIGFYAWCVTGLAVGLSFENLPPAVLAYCVFEIVLLMKSNQPAALRRLVVPLSLCAFGWMVLITARSTRIRADWYRSHLPAPPSHRLGDTVLTFWNTGLALVLAFTLLGALALASRHRRILLPARGLGLLGAGLLSAAFLVVAPYTEPRAFTLLWVAMIALIVNWLTSEVFVKQLAIPVLLAVSIAALLEGVHVWMEYAAFARAVDVRAQYVLSNKGSAACRTGLPITLISTTPDPRLLNNREEWVGGFLDPVGRYFGCKLALR